MYIYKGINKYLRIYLHKGIINYARKKTYISPWNIRYFNEIVNNYYGNNTQIWNSIYTYTHTYTCMYIYLHSNITSMNMYTSMYTLHPFIHTYWLNINICTDIYYHI